MSELSVKVRGKWPKIGAFILSLLTYGIMVYALMWLDKDRDRLIAVNKDMQVRLYSVEQQIPQVAKFMQTVMNLQKAVDEKLTATQVVEVAKIIVTQCYMNQDVGLTESIVFGLIERESKFDPKAISEAHAYGLMQVLPITAENHLVDMGYKAITTDLLLNPVVNVEAGIRELTKLRRYWLSEDIDSWEITLTSYYWGPQVTWLLFKSKGWVSVPSLEYGRGVMTLARAWVAKGL